MSEERTEGRGFAAPKSRLPQKNSWRCHSEPVFWANNPCSSVALRRLRTRGVLRVVYTERSEWARDDSSFEFFPPAQRPSPFQGLVSNLGSSKREGCNYARTGAGSPGVCRNPASRNSVGWRLVDRMVRRWFRLRLGFIG